MSKCAISDFFVQLHADEMNRECCKGLHSSQLVYTCTYTSSYVLLSKPIVVPNRKASDSNFNVFMNFSSC